MASNFLPYGKQCIEDDDIAAVAEVMRSDYLTTGPEVGAFEAEFAMAVRGHHAVAVNSGTAALHMAAVASGFGPGQTALVPSVTFVATASAMRFAGGDVFFVDVDPDTGLITPETVSEALGLARAAGRRVTTLLPVHLNGHLVDMSAMKSLASGEQLTIITDACHALGAAYPDAGGQPGDGQFEDFATFSLHPVKSVTMGEGGVVVTARQSSAEKMRLSRSHGMERNRDLMQHAPREELAPWYYEVAELGYNYRAPDILCALGRSQLRKLDRFIKNRRQLAAIYDGLFAAQDLPHITSVGPGWGRSAWHIYAVLIDFAALGLTRSEVMLRLRGKGIGSQVHYIPLHRQPVFEANVGNAVFPGADRYYERVLSLPLYPGMTETDCQRVVAALGQVLNGG